MKVMLKKKVLILIGLIIKEVLLIIIESLDRFNVQLKIPLFRLIKVIKVLTQSGNF